MNSDFEKMFGRETGRGSQATVFGLAVLNFYRFTVLISIYAALLGKLLSSLLTRRCMQPDYIEHVLKKSELEVESSAG